MTTVDSPPHAVRWDHLSRLTDTQGIFEHALGTARRYEHGYCTDDNARLLIVTSREPDQGPARRLNRLALRFVLDAQLPDGRCRNRMDQTGRWLDQGTTDDCWGRSQWAFGATALLHHEPSMRFLALQAFNRGVSRRSPWLRSNGFAALGAADIVASDPGHGPAIDALHHFVDALAKLPEGEWRWPEARLSYANAMLAEAIIAAGVALNHSQTLDRGIAMLHWLLTMETVDGHLSVAPSGGRGPDDVGPMFDQQPIEVAALADACWRAREATGDATWNRGIEYAAAWFCGSNDIGLAMFDPVSGGGFDGLQPDRVNLNQGAESTLAYVSTMSRARLARVAS